MERYYRTNITCYMPSLIIMIITITAGIQILDFAVYMVIIITVPLVMGISVYKTVRQRSNVKKIIDNGVSQIAEVKKIIKCKSKGVIYYILEVETEEKWHEFRKYYSEPLYNFSYTKKHIPTTVKVYKYGNESYVYFDTAPYGGVFDIVEKNMELKTDMVKTAFLFVNYFVLFLGGVFLIACMV